MRIASIPLCSCTLANLYFTHPQLLEGSRTDGDTKRQRAVLERVALYLAKGEELEDTLGKSRSGGGDSIDVTRPPTGVPSYAPEGAVAGGNPWNAAPLSTSLRDDASQQQWGTVAPSSGGGPSYSPGQTQFPTAPQQAPSFGTPPSQHNGFGVATPQPHGVAPSSAGGQGYFGGGQGWPPASAPPPPASAPRGGGGMIDGFGDVAWNGNADPRGGGGGYSGGPGGGMAAAPPQWTQTQPHDAGPPYEVGSGGGGGGGGGGSAVDVAAQQPPRRQRLTSTGPIPMIEIARGDITEQRTDGIVIEANGHLKLLDIGPTAAVRRFPYPVSHRNILSISPNNHLLCLH